MISQRLINELKQIFKEEYNKDLSDKEAREAGENLVNYFDLLATIDQRIKREEREKTKKAKSGL